MQEVNGEIEELTKLNPELKGLNHNKNNFIETYRALIGITSQYNVDDINAYLHNVRTGSKNKEIIERVEKLTKTTGLRFGWQPAAKTLDKIEAQMKVRPLALHNSAGRS